MKFEKPTVIPLKGRPPSKAFQGLKLFRTMENLKGLGLTKE